MAVTRWNKPRPYMGRRGDPVPYKVDFIWYDEFGHQHRKRPGYPTAAARAAAVRDGCNRMEVQGLPPVVVKQTNPRGNETATARAVLRFYQEGHTQSPGVPVSSQACQERHREILERFFKDDDVSSVTFRRLRDFAVWARNDWRERSVKAKRKPKPLSPVTIKKHLSHLRAAFNHATGQMIDAHVFEKLTKAQRKILFPDEIPAGQYVDWDVVDKIVAELPSRYRDLIRFIRASAFRKGEACAFAWDWIRGDVIEVRVSKTGPRTMPLSKVMAGLLPRRPADGTGIVFADKDGGSIYVSLGAAWRRATEAAGYPGIRIHDLRHSALTDFCTASGDLIAIAAMTGTSIKMLEQVYNHGQVERGRGVLESVATPWQSRKAKRIA